MADERGGVATGGAQGGSGRSGGSAVERRIVSVLFADLVGFTSLSEQLDAEDVATVQDAYFSAVRETVGRYGGVLEKFIGDAAMAVFGVPRTRDDDAERAVRAGLALVGAVEQLGAQLGLPPGGLRLRVGVNAGEVAYATEGPDAGRVTGDAVNTAARLQTAAAPDRVLVGELSAMAVAGAIELGATVELELKGKAEPVRAREAVAVRPVPSRDEALGALRAPLVGRGADLARLEAAFDDSGVGRVVVVAPPGVGKSRLVAELAARTAERGVRVLRARVRPQPGAAFEAVAELLEAAGATGRLETALAAAGATPARRRVVADEVATVLRPALARDHAPTADLAAERAARFTAWLEALDALAAGKPSLWIVEDVHWAGPDLLAFLDDAGADHSDARRLIVATARPSLLESAADWLGGAERLDLSTLDAADAAGLVTALVGDALPADLVATITERSDGNPLFVEELLRTWVDVGILAADPAGGWRLTVEPRDVALPATVQAIYAAQLDDLPGEARLVARRASVAGRRFPTRALQPLGIEERAGGLDVLRRRALLAGPEAEASGEVVFSYRHALLRDAGYRSLARLERARLHAALARWLDESSGARGDAARFVAQHYADALASLPSIGPAEEGLRREDLARAAAAAFERAAEASLAVAAHEEAVRVLRRSLEHTDAADVVDDARRRLRLGAILADTADLEEGIGELTAAVETLAGALPAAAPTYAEAAYRLGLALMQQIRFHEAEALTDAAIQRLGDVDRSGGIRLRALHAWTLAAQGRDEGARDEARLARHDAESVDDLGLQVDVLEHYAATLDELESADPAVWAELAQRARRAGRWRQVAVAARVHGVFVAESDPGAALAVFDEAADEADAHGLTEQRGWLDLARCETLWVLGRWDDALDAGGRSITLGERYAYDRLTFRTWMVVLPLLAARRDPTWRSRYERWWSAAEPRFPPAPSPYALVLRAARLRWLSLVSGAGTEAPAPPDGNLAASLPPFSNPHFLAAVETLVAWWLEAGLLAVAGAAGARWRTVAAEADATPLMRASSALIDAWLAAASGEGVAARDAAHRAIEAAGAIGASWWVARARRVLGEDPSDLEAALGIPS